MERMYWYMKHLKEYGFQAQLDSGVHTWFQDLLHIYSLLSLPRHHSQEVVAAVARRSSNSHPCTLMMLVDGEPLSRGKSRKASQIESQLGWPKLCPRL